MIRFLTLSFLLCLFSVPSFACELTLEGKQKLAAKPAGGSSVYMYTLGGTEAKVSVPVGSLVGFGNYDLTSQTITVDQQYFWKTESGSKINFGRVDAKYGFGADLDGDGIDDPIKFVGLCEGQKRHCRRRGRQRVRANFFYNHLNGLSGFSGSIEVQSRLLGRSFEKHILGDFDGDGRTEVCYIRKRKKIRKSRLHCSRLHTERTGSYSLSLGHAGGKFFVGKGLDGKDSLYHVIKRRGASRVVSYKLAERSKKFSIPTGERFVVGDWLGMGYQQIGVVRGDSVLFFDPIQLELVGSTTEQRYVYTCAPSIHGYS